MDAPLIFDGIHKVTRADVMDAREFPALIEAYALESAIDGMPPPRVKLESYKTYDETGALHVFSAIDEGRLVGFFTFLLPVLPHYSIPLAVSESFYLAPAHRGMMGLRLLARAESQALELGSPGLLICAPFGGKLFELLPKCGYVETNRVFFKRLSYEPSPVC